MEVLYFLCRFYKEEKWMVAKNYKGHIYIKNDLQEILNTEELQTVSTANSVLFFPSNISLEDALDSLKTLEVNLRDKINREGKYGSL